MKTHIRILAWLHIVPCALGLMIGIPLCIALRLDHHAGAPTTFDFIAPLFVCFAIFCIPGIIGGLGLLRFRPWAKVIVLILSVFLIPLLPVGTALGAYAFWALLQTETNSLLAGPPPPCSRRWETKHFSYQPSAQRDLLVVIACVGAFMYLALTIGFALHTDPIPVVFTSTRLIATAIVVFLASAIFWITRVVNARNSAAAHERGAAHTSASTHVGSSQSWDSQYASDPPPPNYASILRRGDDRSAANLEYVSNPAMTVTCSHLQGIERAMREAGIDCVRYRETDISVKCRIDIASLKAAFPIAEPVRYSEFYAGEARHHENPMAFLICDEHKSMIHTLHPEVAGGMNAPPFPAAGA